MRVGGVLLNLLLLIRKSYLIQPARILKLVTIELSELSNDFVFDDFLGDEMLYVCLHNICLNPLFGEEVVVFDILNVLLMQLAHAFVNFEQFACLLVHSQLMIEHHNQDVLDSFGFYRGHLHVVKTKLLLL